MNSTNREVIDALFSAVPSSDQTDAFVIAYQSGDLMELGRLTASMFNQYISDQRWRKQSSADESRFSLSSIGQDQVNAVRLAGGVL